jgi:hypothetical protein
MNGAIIFMPTEIIVMASLALILLLIASVWAVAVPNIIPVNNIIPANMKGR